MGGGAECRGQTSNQSVVRFTGWGLEAIKERGDRDVWKEAVVRTGLTPEGTSFGDCPLS